jgi:serine/threonine protein kinase
MDFFRFWKRKGTASAEKAQRAAPKKTLGMFVVEREIGRGSMGVVYLGTDPESGREVAIKTMNLADDFNAEALEDAKERFVREARILTWLDHPDIVTIYDVGEEHGIAYIAMEFVRGVELSEHTKQGTLLPLPKVLEIVARAADALGYAHEQDIVHRDVKPGNIMYDPATNMVKVMDFGISRLINLSTTRVGLVLGTPLYMSPEQVMGQPITGLSDLFSLGSTLYQLLSGHVPFDGDSHMEVMQRIVKDPPADILQFNPNIPPEVCAVLERALQKEMGARYQTGAEMAEAIRQCAAKLAHEAGR